MDLKMNAGEPLFELRNEWGDQIGIHSSERTDDEAASLRSVRLLDELRGPFKFADRALCMIAEQLPSLSECHLAAEPIKQASTQLVF